MPRAENVSSEFNDLVPRIPPLVETESLRQNLEIITNYVDAGARPLLEGDTGIGKSAVVMEAARRLCRPLIRFNMSSKITTASFFGAPLLQSSTSGTEVVFQDGPFTEAFRMGYWLLIDEFNLAPEGVLNSLEQALDLGRLSLTVPVELDGGERFIEYEQHPEFAVFATQNPCTGLFRGAREQHSSTLLNRFSPVKIKRPTDEDVRSIVQHTLLSNGVSSGKAETLSIEIVSFHHKVLSCISDSLFNERKKRLVAALYILYSPITEDKSFVAMRK